MARKIVCLSNLRNLQFNIVHLTEVFQNKKMGPTGFEPATTRLRAKCSARLSYGPI